MPRRLFLTAVAILLLAGFAAAVPLPSAANAAGAAERRVAAEILIMKGDARRLAEPVTKPQHRKGLATRLQGALATLPLLIAAARDENPGLPAPPAGLVERLRAALAAGDAGGLEGLLTDLADRYPFRATGLLPPDTRPAAIARVSQIYEDYCAACHAQPDLSPERPAWNLFDMTAMFPPREMAARLVVGVKGENLMALENPLTDAEISGLLALFAQPHPKP